MQFSILTSEPVLKESYHDHHYEIVVLKNFGGFFFACDGLAYMMLSCGSQPRLESEGKKCFNSLLSAFNPFLFNHALRQKKIFNRGPEDFSLNSSLQAGCLF